MKNILVIHIVVTKHKNQDCFAPICGTIIILVTTLFCDNDIFIHKVTTIYTCYISVWKGVWQKFLSQKFKYQVSTRTYFFLNWTTMRSQKYLSIAYKKQHQRSTQCFTYGFYSINMLSKFDTSWNFAHVTLTCDFMWYSFDMKIR